MDAVRGVRLVLTTPRMWPLCLLPLLGTVLVYVLLGVLGGMWLVPKLEAWLGGGPFARVAELAALVVWVLLFPWLFVLIGGGVVGLIFEPLAQAVEAVEAARTGSPLVDQVHLSMGENLADGFARFALSAMLGAGAFLLGFVLGPIPGIVTAACAGLLDTTAPAFLRRGVRLGAQMTRLRQARSERGAVLSFALAAGLLSLVPGVGVLLLPGLVAGGTLLVRRLEEQGI